MAHWLEYCQGLVGDLDGQGDPGFMFTVPKFSKEDVAKMEEICAKRRAYLANLEAVLNDTGIN